jgi:hypothetical protein
MGTSLVGSKGRIWSQVCTAKLTYFPSSRSCLQIALELGLLLATSGTFKALTEDSDMPRDNWSGGVWEGTYHSGHQLWQPEP